MKILIIVPAVNESRSIGTVIKDLKKFGYKNIVVIDDGSSDGTGKIAEKLGVNVVRHIINRGLGAGIKSGLECAKLTNADIAVTFDADGQHKAVDVKKLIEPILDDSADVVIGSRMSSFKKEMPFDRLILNYIANFLTLFLYGLYSSDSQSGLRAFNRRAIYSMGIKTDRMEISSEILREVKRNKLRFAEVPIRPIYTSYSRLTGQQNLNALSVGFKMLLRIFH